MVSPVKFFFQVISLINPVTFRGTNGKDQVVRCHGCPPDVKKVEHRKNPFLPPLFASFFVSNIS